MKLEGLPEIRRAKNGNCRSLSISLYKCDRHKQEENK